MELETIAQSLQSWFSDHGWRILLILAISSIIRRFGVVLLGRVIDHSIESSDRFENKRDRTLRADTLIGLVDSVLKVTTYLVVGVLILSELNVLKVVAPLLAGAGVLSLLLGFGIQTFVKDFISGIFIVAENQYRVGDVVSVSTSIGGGVEGTVTRITLRTTVLRDNDGAIHFIPNGNIARAANQTLDYAKVNIEIELPITTNLDKLEREISDLGLRMSKEDLWHKSLIQAPFYHGVHTFNTETITIEVRAKTIPAEQWRVSSELQKRLAALVSKNNPSKPTTKKS
jgi:small conductance mechanosensitive channel